MSYHVFFSLSTGLSTSIQVPKGSKSSILSYVNEVEAKLGLKREKYKDNPVHWDRWNRDLSKIEGKLLCTTVEHHNRWVREWYENFAFWAEKPFTVGKGYQDEGPNRRYPVGWGSETITPDDAKEFWHGFEMLEVPLGKWTREYYVARMEVLYEVMRGRPSEGITFGTKALTPRQAAEVINLFSEYLDSHDMRLDVPKDRDYLASSYDGGYDWCEKCGAVTPEDGIACRKRKCPLREEYEE